MMDSKPSDYSGSQIDWEMNVLLWFLKIIEQDDIDEELINNLAIILERSK